MRTRLFPVGFAVFDSVRAALPEGITTSFGGWTSTAKKCSRPQRRWPYWAAGLPAAAVFGTWLAIRTFPSFGPALADQLRAMVGSENVTELEELVAGVEDQVRLTVANQGPRALAEATPPELYSSAAPQNLVLQGSTSAFSPKDVPAMFPAVATPDDGRWQSVPVPGSTQPVIYRTVLHPDARRSYAELFVFALDLSRVGVHAVAGSVEPKSPGSAAPRVDRPGRIDPHDESRLIAAFNGGFKAEHGQFGMMVDGVRLLAPKSGSCTLAAQEDGSLRIGTWSQLATDESSFVWWRQTPPCMVEDGQLHAGLQTDSSKNWGATLEGSTVIRRSAVGLDESGKLLFVGISNSTTARALALGMQHAGARHVAQMDVNFSYPKFLLYRDEGGQRSAISAVKGFMYEQDDYVRRASTRDFFYVTLEDATK